MRFSLYIDKKTAIHEMHPVSKMICLLIIFSWALVLVNPSVLAPVFLCILLAGFFSGSQETFYRMRYFLIVLFCVSFLLWSLLHRGTHILFKFGFISWSSESVKYGLGMGLRLVILVMTGLMFVSTTRVEDFTVGLNMIGIPYRMSFALSLAFRLVSVFMASGQKVVQSQTIRGLDLDKGNIFRRAVKYVPVIIPVFMTAVRQANDLAVALESKGFGYSKKRIYYRRFPKTKKDIIIPVVLFIVFLVLLMCRIKGIG